MAQVCEQVRWHQPFTALHPAGSGLPYLDESLQYQERGFSGRTYIDETNS